MLGDPATVKFFNTSFELSTLEKFKLPLGWEPFSLIQKGHVKRGTLLTTPEGKTVQCISGTTL